MQPSAADVSQGVRNGRDQVGGTPCDGFGNRGGGRVARYMNRPDAGLQIEFLGPHMRAGTDASGPKFQLAWLGLYRRNELPDTSDAGGFACDQHIGLAGEWSDRNKIHQWVIGQVLHEC